MSSEKKTVKMEAIKGMLSTLWIFLTVNYIYCDLLHNLEPGVLADAMAGYVAGGTVQITPVFLLGTAIMMELPFAMILLSRVLKYRVNRWANIVVGIIMAAFQVVSLFLGTPSDAYCFYSIIEIACALFIVWSAWKWPKQEGQP